MDGLYDSRIMDISTVIKTGLYHTKSGYPYFYKQFADDREYEILAHINKCDPSVTIPIIKFGSYGAYMEVGETINIETEDIIINKIKVLEKLHKIDVFHNDLGIFNWMLYENSVRLIDFGSSFFTNDEEWLKLLYENIYLNDDVTITSKKDALDFEMYEFINSYKH